MFGKEERVRRGGTEVYYWHVDIDWSCGLEAADAAMGRCRPDEAGYGAPAWERAAAEELCFSEIFGDGVDLAVAIDAMVPTCRGLALAAA